MALPESLAHLGAFKGYQILSVDRAVDGDGVELHVCVPARSVRRESAGSAERKL